MILDNRERSEVTGTNQPEGKRKTQGTGERERRKYAAIVFCYQENEALQEADALFSRPTCLSKQRHPNGEVEMRILKRLLNIPLEMIQSSGFTQSWTLWRAS